MKTLPKIIRRDGFTLRQVVRNEGGEGGPPQGEEEPVGTSGAADVLEARGGRMP